MRCLFVSLAIALSSASGSVRAAQPQTVSVVHLITTAPRGGGGVDALYDFSFTSDQGDFKSGTVFFNLKNGVRYGCGVHINTRCTLHAAGQTLKLFGLSDGIQGIFSWFQDSLADNRPMEISIAVPLPSDALAHFDSRITQTTDLPEPSAWMMMIAGFGLLGTALRATRKAPPRLQPA